MHGGDRIAEVLVRHGARALFTLCGGHISPILTAANARGLRVVDVRDEAAAVFAADALARLTGAPGVAAVTAGPGVTNALTALTNARLAQSPVVVLAGAVPTVLRGRGALQDIDQRAVARPHVKWFVRARRVADLAALVTRACSVARSDVPGPVVVECPVDLLYDEALVRQWYAAGTEGTRPTLVGRLERWYLQRHVTRMLRVEEEAHAVVTPSTPLPSSASVQRAAALLAQAERPLLLAGSQALAEPARAPALAAAVERLGVPTYLSGMARGLLGRRHALLLRHARRAALREADLVILAGVPCDFRLDYGRHIARGAHVVSANRSATEARRNRRPAVRAIGDAAVFLVELTGAVAPQPRWGAWLAQLQRRDAEREAEIAAQATTSGAYVNPLALCLAIEQQAAEDSVFILDGGDFAATASYIVAPRGPLRHLDPGAFGTLGAGGGFALGAALGRPDAEVWILYGDGAAAYSLAEFDTFLRHGVAVIAVVGTDGAWAQIAREQVPALGDDVGTALRRTDYQVVAQGYGGDGLLVRRADELPAALARARTVAAEGRPVLVNVWLDRSDFRKGAISMQTTATTPSPPRG